MGGKKKSRLAEGDFVKIEKVTEKPNIDLFGEESAPDLDLEYVGQVVHTYSGNKKKHLVCVFVHELGGVVDFPIKRVSLTENPSKAVGTGENSLRKRDNCSSLSPSHDDFYRVKMLIALELQLESARNVQNMSNILLQTYPKSFGQEKILNHSKSLYDRIEKVKGDMFGEKKCKCKDMCTCKFKGRVSENEETEKASTLFGKKRQRRDIVEDAEERRQNNTDTSGKAEQDQSYSFKESYILIQQKKTLLISTLKRVFSLSKNPETNSHEIEELCSALSAGEKVHFLTLIHVENPRHRLLMQQLTGRVKDLEDSESSKSLERAIFRLIERKYDTKAERNYTDNELRCALLSWCTGRGSQEDLRLCFGVPRQTLGRHLSALNKHLKTLGVTLPKRPLQTDLHMLNELLDSYMMTLKKRGGQRVLTEEEEALIAAKLGIESKAGLTRREVRVKIKRIVDEILLGGESDVNLSPGTRARLENFKASRAFERDFVNRNNLKNSIKKRK